MESYGVSFEWFRMIIPVINFFKKEGALGTNGLKKKCFGLRLSVGSPSSKDFVEHLKKTLWPFFMDEVQLPQSYT